MQVSVSMSSNRHWWLRVYNIPTLVHIKSKRGYGEDKETDIQIISVVN